MLTKLQQRIDTDIDTLYRIVQELPGINQTVFHDLTRRMDRQPTTISSTIKVLFLSTVNYMNNRIFMKATDNAALVRTELFNLIIVLMY